MGKINIPELVVWIYLPLNTLINFLMIWWSLSKLSRLFQSLNNKNIYLESVFWNQTLAVNFLFLYSSIVSIRILTNYLTRRTHEIYLELISWSRNDKKNSFERFFYNCLNILYWSGIRQIESPKLIIIYWFFVFPEN